MRDLGTLAFIAEAGNVLFLGLPEAATQCHLAMCGNLQGGYPSGEPHLHAGGVGTEDGRHGSSPGGDLWRTRRGALSPLSPVRDRRRGAPTGRRCWRRMLSLPPAVRIFVATQPTNMHLSFDRLAALARDVLQQDPLSGHLFVFRNRSGDKVKILGWDRSGFCLWYKRLEQGVFHFPRAATTPLEVDAAELTLLLDGIDLTAVIRRPRFRRRLVVAGA